MTTESVAETAVKDILPYLRPGFTEAWRKAGRAVGYRQLGKALRYVVVPETNGYRETVVAHETKRERRWRENPLVRGARNAAGGLKVPAPGGYQRDAGRAFGMGNACSERGYTGELTQDTARVYAFLRGTRLVTRSWWEQMLAGVIRAHFTEESFVS